jgi:hypothetical protein
MQEPLSEEFDAPSDEVALERAAEALEGAPFELWRGQQRVHPVQTGSLGERHFTENPRDERLTTRLG